MTLDDLSQKLNMETGKITWPELQRYFARGVIIIVAGELDLIEVAKAISSDNKSMIEDLMISGKIVRASDAHAKQWHDTNALFWATVVAPWVLVQEISEQ